MSDAPATIATMPRRHRWNESPPARRPGIEFADGNDRTEKTCANPGCGLVKITVHSPDNRHWNEWRHGSGKAFQCDYTPPCVGTERD